MPSPYDDYEAYDETDRSHRLTPLAPAVLWGVVMAAAMAGAGAAVWRASDQPDQRLVSAGAEPALRRELARLQTERDQLAGRVAALERRPGGERVASSGSGPEITGSIGRAGERSEPKFGLSLGIEASQDAAKRRWAALAAQFPLQLSPLAPLARRERGKSALFDLIAGPFSSREEAERVCGALAEQGLACDTTDYAGEPIGRT